MSRVTISRYSRLTPAELTVRGERRIGCRTTSRSRDTTKINSSSVNAQSPAAAIARIFRCRRIRWLFEWLYESSISPRHQSKERGWRGSQAGEPGREIPIGQVKKPRRRPTCLSLSETPPARTRKRYANEDVLRQDPPGEGYDHR
ncbi:hypothetical protein NSU_4709 [Novosphingobium pentaromativorans US6-1]|uniref:Uncharacterized protein n=1 Tax=Novosphingobium pentaromativorans US6-1 TaxID=1088721 RepID=G6EK38_9SPHN|nr:hypothetical protein NSU_4709 [Novosphingobium pentaromativorans US6-1]